MLRVLINVRAIVMRTHNVHVYDKKKTQKGLHTVELAMSTRL